MIEFDIIESLKDSKEKVDKLVEFYKDKIHINKWLTNEFKTSIINFKDRIEYKKFGYYHRINGPAIDYKDETKDQYFYKGKKYNSKSEWSEAVLKEVRKIKIKKLKSDN
jgi:hypothetical protein